MDINIRLTVGLSDELASFIRSVVPGAGDALTPEKGRRALEVLDRPIETAGAPNAVTEPDTSASATGASAASPAPKARGGRKGQSATPASGEALGDDPFTPAASAAAPAASPAPSSASDAAETTKQDVLDAMSKWLDRDGHTPLQLKTEFETRFKQADGTPAASAGKLQPKDYAAAVAFLKA